MQNTEKSLEIRHDMSCLLVEFLGGWQALTSTLIGT